MTRPPESSPTAPVETTCADYLAQTIVETGCGTVFALAGATHAPLLFALEDRGATIVGGRHESGTVGAADGYARRTGRTGFALIVAEQGLANAMTALMTAAQGETPLVVIATRFPDSWVEPAAQYAVDRHELTAPFLKFSRTVPSPDRIGEYVHAAIKAANEGVPGPALLILPLDFMGKVTQSLPRPTAPVLALPGAEAGAIAAMAALLEGAARPIIVTDNRAAQSDTAGALTALSRMGIAVLGNGLGRGLAPEVAPHGYPWPYAQRAAAEADLVLVVGARMNLWFGYGLSPRFAKGARFIHLDSSAEAIGRNTDVELAVVADPGRSLDALAARLGEQGFARDPAWIEEALAPRAQCIEALLGEYGENLHPVAIGAELDRHLPEERVLVCDGADSANFTHARMRVNTPRAYSDLLPFGAMGAGFPIAVGMAAGEAEDARRQGRAPVPVVLVTGDGSLGFFLAELDTLARGAIPLTIVVSNDGKWGTEYHGQALAYGRTSNTELGQSDYAAIARAFGMSGVVVSTRSQLSDAVRASVGVEGPMLIDARVDTDSGRIRKTEPLLGMILFEDIPSH
ncbi:thiamine pyrophosphate-binding protein [Novosphingobium profundi]|uniref:thiamine pyrophosphate-binding protein n=1 Tax=Novosphingobium profundi TaxID=1774954 RepID=UPI001BD9D6A0|nr:thiamine pyrophosphate-binding protein [Novosphingobium profundi]MBT0670713.1 thiamine pyrophosphate-binding protein [Novosphingobium profundi]